MFCDVVMSAKVGVPVATSVTPRLEPKLDCTMPALPGVVGFRQLASELSSEKFAPPSVDFQSPYGGRPATSETVPPVTELLPRIARAEPTYSVLPATAM